MSNNSIYVVLISSVVSILMVALIIIPVIDDGQSSKSIVDNEPVTYTYGMTGSEINRSDISISFDGTLNVTVNGVSYSVESPSFSSVLISDGVNARLNGGSMDVYGPDGVLYKGQTISKVRGDTITVWDSQSADHVYTLPSFCYVSIGKSEQAKQVQTSGLYEVNDHSKLDSTSPIVVIGKNDDGFGVSARATVQDYLNGERTGGIVINSRGVVQTPSTVVIISNSDAGQGHKDYSIDGGTIKEVTS